MSPKHKTSVPNNTNDHPLVRSRREAKESLNKALYAATVANDVKLAASLIKRGAVVCPSHRYVFSVTTPHLFAPVEN